MSHIKIPDIKFDFDDVLIVPQITTEVSSRYKDIKLPSKLPLITAPMDTVVDFSNMNEYLNRRITVCLPRTINYKDYYRTFLNNTDSVFFNAMATQLLYSNDIFVSIGLDEVNDLTVHNSPMLLTFKNILIDVANGHMETIIDACKAIRIVNPEIKIMVGNIANPETYGYYAEHDVVDYIRVGIGNGNGCLTTKQTGVGYPKASLIHETYKVKQEFIETFNFRKKNEYNLLKVEPYKRIPAIVADGGMKDYADIVKALALGADYVMIGSIFNKALESCAQNYLYGIKFGPKTATKLFKKGYPIKKYFRGMSTKAAQKAMGKTLFKTSEGVIRFRKVEYTLEKWIENFEHYLRTAMSYSGAYTLDEFIGKTNFCQITKNAYDRFNK